MSRLIGTALVAVVIALAPSVGRACPFCDVDWTAQAQYELSGVHATDRATDPTTRAPGDLVLGGFRLSGSAGGKRLEFAASMAMAAGATVRDGGFGYDVSVLPFGVALRLGDTSFIALGVGVGASGAVGTLDDAVTLPIEARFEIGRAIRVLGRVRASYVDSAPDRMDGGVTTTFADELEAMLALRLGHAYDDWGFPSGNGYFVGATAHEALGTRYLGLVIGYSVDMASRRREPVGL